jgi:hypothetical protein
MAGLDPAIHVLATGTGDADNRVDARVKPAHDDLQLGPKSSAPGLNVCPWTPACARVTSGSS